MSIAPIDQNPGSLWSLFKRGITNPIETWLTQKNNLTDSYSTNFENGADVIDDYTGDALTTVTTAVTNTAEKVANSPTTKLALVAVIGVSAVIVAGPIVRTAAKVVKR